MRIQVRTSISVRTAVKICTGFILHLMGKLFSKRSEWILPFSRQTSVICADGATEQSCKITTTINAFNCSCQPANNSCAGNDTRIIYLSIKVCLPQPLEQHRSPRMERNLQEVVKMADHHRVCRVQNEDLP